MAKALKNGTYKVLSPEEWVMGGYSFTFVANGKKYEFGYSGGNVIRYGGNQYKIKNNKFRKLLSLTK